VGCVLVVLDDVIFTLKTVFKEMFLIIILRINLASVNATCRTDRHWDL